MSRIGLWLEQQSATLLPRWSDVPAVEPQAMVPAFRRLRALVLEAATAAGLEPTAADVGVVDDFVIAALAERMATRPPQRQEPNALLVRVPEAELRETLDALPVLVSFVARDQRYGFVNKAYESWFGVPREAIIGKTLVELIGDVAYAQLLPFVERALAGERFSFEQHAVPYRLGGRRDVRVEFVPRRDVGGAVDGYVALLQDITAQRAADHEREALLAREQLARAEAQAERDKQHSLFMQAPVAIAILDGSQHVFTFANPAYRALVNGRDVIGKSLAEALPDVEGADFDRLLDDVMATGKPLVVTELSIELEHHADDERLIVNFVYAPKRNAAGHIDGVLVTGWDVTEQVQAREKVEALANELRQSQERVRRVVEASGAGLWDLDSTTGQIATDERMRELMGMAPGSALALESGLDKLPFAEDAKRVRGAINAALDGEQGGRYLVEFRTGGHGQVPLRWVESRAQITFDADGNPSRLAGAMIDVTARKTAEQEREGARLEAEQANRAKDEFLAMLGHEMRNPLAPIVTALQLMKLRHDDTFASERIVIERQVNHLAGLVDDLLDVSRITSGKVTIHRQRLNLASVVSDAIEIASPLLEARKHHLRVTVPAQGLMVDGDPLRLSQIVSNLLTNAAKYTEPGGLIEVGAAQQGESVVLRVRDNGVGIAADMLPRVFELFTQERQSVDRARGGLGLGLAIVRTLVTLHGGSVTARSEGHGQGSELTVTLPLASAPAELAATAGGARVEPSRPTSSVQRVLIVDDNSDAAELLATTLELLGHQTRVAHDGPSALEAVATFVPDVAVLDIGLPAMDGYELGQRLRQMPQLAKLRMFALTGYGQLSDHRRSAAAGFDAHLVKPIQIAKLEALINESGK